jgi:hypothetical protein
MEPLRLGTTEGWLTPDETLFLENTLRDHKLFQYLYTQNSIRLRYPSRYQGSYQDFAAKSNQDFERAHQTLRRLMHKSPYSLTGGQRAYTVIPDDQIPLRELEIGSQITLGYRLLLLRPKYDIGKHSSLLELVFPVSVKILPVGTTYYIMDEDHIFQLMGFERRSLTEHPSHGTPYHIDLLRLVATSDVRIPTEERSRIHVMLDQDEKSNIVISRDNWASDSLALAITQASHGKDEISLKDFENFKRGLGTTTSRFSEETLTVLFRVTERKRNIITKLLFEVHTHTLKLSHLISAFTNNMMTDTRFSDLEARLAESVASISRELDTYFMDESGLSTANATLYMVMSYKHMQKIGDKLGSMILFDNYLVGYTSTDSITDRVASHPSYVIVSLQIPPRMPVLMLPEHTGISKYHRAIILPRDTVFQVEEIRSMMVLNQPRTYRKLFVLRYRRTNTPTTREGRAARQPLGVQLGTTHLLQIEPELLSTIARDTRR